MLFHISIDKERKRMKLTVEAVEVCEAEDVCSAALGVAVGAAADEGLALVEGWHC